MALGWKTVGRLFMRAAPIFNAPVAAVLASPRLAGLANGTVAMLTYTGRRSGRTFSTPVAYRRAGDEIVINVNMPEVKTWWQNFLGEGAPLNLRIGEAEHSGHGIARRDDNGRVTVAVELDH